MSFLKCLCCLTCSNILFEYIHELIFSSVEVYAVAFSKQLAFVRVLFFLNASCNSIRKISQYHRASCIMLHRAPKLNSVSISRFHLKNRFSWRLLQQGETERERLFSVYNYASQVANGLVPASRDLANYLTGLMTFIELGEFNNHVSKHTVGIKIMEIIKQYYPKVYLQSLDNAALNLLCFTIQSYWSDVTSARASAVSTTRNTARRKQSIAFSLLKAFL